jgi:aspartate aminotransferase
VYPYSRMAAPTFSFSERSSRLRPTAVNSILAEVRALPPQARPLVSLMRGEPDLSTSPHLCAAAAAALARGRTSYPDNRGEMVLRDAVTTKLSRDNDLRYDAGTEVLVTTGATFGIYAALTALLNEGDEVLLPEPIYDAYHSPVRLAGGTAITVPSALTSGRFTLDLDGLQRAITPATRMLLLNTPWNPVGTVLTRRELESVVEIVLRHNLILISDEIYEAIVYDGHRHVSPAALAPEVQERTILVNSLSKTYAMTGWRVGYCAGPAAIIQAMFLVLQQSSRGPATFIQDAAAEALQGSQQAVEDMRLEYARRRAVVIAALTGIPRVNVLAPEGGFFAMLDVRELGRSSNEIRRELLTEAGVVVIHGSAYGPAGEGTLRVSFASGGQTLTDGLERLRAGLARL